MSHDENLVVAPIRMADGTEKDSPDLSALEFLKELKAIHQPFENETYPQAVLNERFMHGDQIIRKNESDERVVDADVYWPTWLTAVSRNLLRNPALTWAARVTEKDPSSKCWPKEGGPLDPAAAEVGDKVLAYYRQRYDHRQQLVTAGWKVQADGTVIWRIVWDPDKGPKSDIFADGTGGEALGDVFYEVVSLFNFLIDPVENIEDARWCAFRKWKTVDEARRLLGDRGIYCDDLATNTPWTTWTRRTDLVECIELWVKPGADARFPAGLLIQYVGDNVLHVEDFPYEHGELPCAMWKCSTLTDYPYGDTHVSDAVPLQNNYNKLHACLTTITAKTAKWMKVFIPDWAKGSFDGADEVVHFKTAEADSVGVIKMITAPPPSPLIVAQIEEHERMIDKVFGVNEAVVGSDASQSKNARHLAYMSQLDAQKQKEARVSLESAVVRRDRQSIFLNQQYVSADRTVRLLGEGGEWQEVAYSGALFNGIDVTVETAPGVDQGNAAEAQDAEQAAAAGLEDPTRAREIRKTGTTTTRYESIARAMVQAQAAQAMQGLAVAVEPSIPAETAVSELQLILAASKGKDEATLAPLRTLLQQYQEAVTAAAQPMPQAGGAVKPIEPTEEESPL